MMIVDARRFFNTFKKFNIFLLLLVLMFATFNGIPFSSTTPEGSENPRPSALDESAPSPITVFETIAPAIDMGAVDYTVMNSPGSFNGYTLFNFYTFDSSTSAYNNSLIIMDMNGGIVAQKNIGSGQGSSCPAEFIDPNTILVGTEWGAALWHLGNDTLQFLNIFGHHEYEYNPNSNTVFSLSYNFMIIDSVPYLFDYIREYTMNGTLVWEMDVHDFISEDWWCPSHETSQMYRDISHSNTIFYDSEEDMIYFNARNVNTFYKIDHSTSEVIWGLGEYGDFTMYDIKGNPRNHLFFHAHSVEKVNENTFILFDNDYHNQTSALSRLSRILELEINETSMIANEVWYYTAPTAYFSAGWGDADRLPNGNRIGCWGYPSTPSSGFSAAFVEVNPQGEIVWETRFMYDLPYLYGSYRLERFRFEPIISSPSDLTGLNQDGNITWDVHYNYRNKEPLPGNYTLYFDGTITQSGAFTYAKFWNPTSLVMLYGDLGLGVHNLTLAVSDGFGNIVTDTVMLTIQNFLISRSGYTILEKGQQSFLPRWTGSTISELNGNITLNGTLFMSLNWTGQDIIIDPDLMEVGTHFVEFNLYNDTLLVHNETFWLQVTPSEPPDIVPLQPTAVPYNWSQQLVLSWELYDVTAHSWILLVNGTETASDTWSPPNYRLDWEVPVLTVAIYNITIVVDDDLGQVTTNECLLTVSEPTMPYILSSPGDSTIIWGSEGVSFIWDVVGGTQWMVFRNNVLLDSGDVTSYVVEFSIEDWVSENWKPGLYNLTIVCILDELSASDTIWVDIVVDPGDPYADDFLPGRSQWYTSGQNAIGAPDGLYTTLFPDYEDGYISLDMGENEEIVNGPHSDFTVEAQGGNYIVYVTNSLDIAFELVGTGSGQMRFDLVGTSLDEARYVRIQYLSGDDVELDAIVAINYNIRLSDTTPPNLIVYGDLNNMQLGTSATLFWHASDETPWSYDIYVNSQMVFSDFWNGSNITYLFEPTAVGWWNVTVVAYDAFGNFEVSVVMIEVYDRSIPLPILILVGGLAIGAFVVMVVVIRLKKK
ncbi:MAG: aryl-sulfate sulfotransferase [Candidatus Thorarchaeota archaeon]|nr:aryl-sulfate sulfotransferase [Candidatus Thorarchaeota archaeon]